MACLCQWHWSPPVLGGMICGYSFMFVACEPNLHEAWKPSWFVYVREEVVIGPANHDYAWVTCTKECCTAMALRVSGPMLKPGSRKGGTLGGWFSEPPNTELGIPTRRLVFPHLVQGLHTA